MPVARARRHRAAFRQFLQCRGDTAPGRVGACSDRLSTMSAFAEDKESDYGTVKKVRFARARACETRRFLPRETLEGERFGSLVTPPFISRFSPPDLDASARLSVSTRLLTSPFLEKGIRPRRGGGQDVRRGDVRARARRRGRAHRRDHPSGGRDRDHPVLRGNLRAHRGRPRGAIEAASLRGARTRRDGEHLRRHPTAA